MEDKTAVLKLLEQLPEETTLEEIQPSASPKVRLDFAIGCCHLLQLDQMISQQFLREAITD